MDQIFQQFIGQTSPSYLIQLGIMNW